MTTLSDAKMTSLKDKFGAKTVEELPKKKIRIKKLKVEVSKKPRKKKNE